MNASHPDLETQWFWKTDQGNWSAYSLTICRDLEAAFGKGTRKWPVDSERFVDTIAMEQRRFDLTGKPRQVKRELVRPLKEQIIYLAGKPKPNWVELVSQLGGIITPFITKKVRKFRNYFD